MSLLNLLYEFKFHTKRKIQSRIFLYQYIKLIHNFELKLRAKC